MRKPRGVKCEMSCLRSHSWQSIRLTLEPLCAYDYTKPHESCLSCGLWEVRWDAELEITELTAARIACVVKKKVLMASGGLIKRRAHEPESMPPTEKDPRNLRSSNQNGSIFGG